ncbi:magnetosome protein MamD [Magnetofaba australis]|uniref:MamD n=1 Tax=Magnetofaba australis IT-1 TaxID=1434232 RepID=W0LJE9_9PROT|nr:magnetosome protein MamD [Magnetofaba australis]AHG23916.1 MamD [Magnetofaba australis IT-1]OSM08663.1 putative magnetosome protein MamD [Magnetofaba australis IT-1]
MLTDPVIVKIEGATQSAQLAGLKGKSFTIAKMQSVGGQAGMGGKWVFLQPAGEAAASPVAVKLNSTQAATQLNQMSGQSFTVGSSPTVLGGMGNSKWLTLNPATSGTQPVAAKAQAKSALVMMKVENAAQASQISQMAGKKFTVMPAPMMGGKAQGWLFLQPTGAEATGEPVIALKAQNGVTASEQIAKMTGKSFVVGKAPASMGANAGKWLILQPASSATAGGAAAGNDPVITDGGGAVAQPAAWNPAPAKATIKTVALTGGATTGAGAAKGAASATAATGTIWNGGGMSLGLGLGLGAWGPALILGAAAVGVGVYTYKKRGQTAVAEADAETLEDTLS